MKRPAGKPLAASLITTVGGVIILAAAIMAAVSLRQNPALVSSIVSSIRGYGVTGANVLNTASLVQLLQVTLLIGAISGIVVIVSGIAMYAAQPANIRRFAILALVFSIISIFGGGGKLIGLVLGVIGSVMALRRKG